MACSRYSIATDTFVDAGAFMEVLVRAPLQLALMDPDYAQLLAELGMHRCARSRCASAATASVTRPSSPIRSPRSARCVTLQDGSCGRAKAAREGCLASRLTIAGKGQVSVAGQVVSRHDRKADGRTCRMEPAARRTRAKRAFDLVAAMSTRPGRALRRHLLPSRRLLAVRVRAPRCVSRA